MPRDGAIGNLRRPFANRYRIDDVSWMVAHAGRRPCAPILAMSAEVLQQFTLEHPTTLHKQASIDRLVRHVHLSIARKRLPKPAGNLLRGPLLGESCCHDLSQARPLGEATRLRTPRACPRATIGALRSIPCAAAMAANFPADGGGRPSEPSSETPHRLGSGQPARDFFSVRRGQGMPRTATWSRRDAPLHPNDAQDSRRISFESRRNIGYGLTGMPATPQFIALSPREPGSTNSHNTSNHAWCCADSLKSPLLLPATCYLLLAT